MESEENAEGEAIEIKNELTGKGRNNGDAKGCAYVSFGESEDVELL